MDYIFPFLATIVVLICALLGLTIDIQQHKQLNNSSFITKCNNTVVNKAIVEVSTSNGIVIVKTVDNETLWCSTYSRVLK